MTNDVCAAVRNGQQRLARTASHYHQHCLELALDELLRHPDCTGEPAQLLAAAVAHARTHLRRRRVIQPIDAASDLLAKRGSDRPEAEDAARTTLHLIDWVRRAPLTSRQRGLLLLAVADRDESSICHSLRMSPEQLRQAMSRARCAARRCRDLERLSA